MQHKLSFYHVATPPFLDPADGAVNRIVLATRSGQVRIIDEGTWQRLLAGAPSLPDALMSELAGMQLLVPADENELQQVLARSNASSAASSDYYSVIQPTALCQLGCDYCGQEHTSKQLSEVDQDLVLERISNGIRRSNRYASLSICWFGGEPLLGLAAMRRMTPRLIEIAAAANCTYGAKLVTNGVALTPALISELVGPMRVKQIEVTLDGIAEVHDARRHNKGGGRTFERIFANLLALAKCAQDGLSVSVRCNVDRRNYHSVSPLLRQLAEAGLQGKIRFYVASVYSWGNTAHELALSPEEFAAMETDWLTQQVELGFDPQLIPAQKSIVCMAVKPESRLYDAYGNIFNCTEVSYVPSYGMPNKYLLGQLWKEDATSARDRLGDFNQKIEDGAYQCSSCCMLPVCGGGCPKKWLEGYVPCPSSKRNMRDRLQLMYAASLQQQA
ncbi:radical SAM protein [Pseudoduganella sp. FT55W]|uniref:Radical SAM protein n=1 Tax=Duganella rivi TaxID=2666083 RepID=A0A7X4K978_9BURK|nr:radical SAM protein [Duganella rivi]MYM65721.1 radical SAM protein [Duganella rivi]